MCAGDCKAEIKIIQSFLMAIELFSFCDDHCGIDCGDFECERDAKLCGLHCKLCRENWWNQNKKLDFVLIFSKYDHQPTFAP